MHLYLAGSDEKGYMDKLKVMISGYQFREKSKILRTSAGHGKVL